MCVIVGIFSVTVKLSSISNLLFDMLIFIDLPFMSFLVVVEIKMPYNMFIEFHLYIW